MSNAGFYHEDKRGRVHCNISFLMFSSPHTITYLLYYYRLYIYTIIDKYKSYIKNPFNTECICILRCRIIVGNYIQPS